MTENRFKVVSDGASMPSRILIGGGIFIALFIILSPMAFVTIDEGERGVSIVLGRMQDKSLTPGLHFRWPLIENIETMSVRVEKSDVTGRSSSKDLQLVKIVTTVQYSLSADKIPNYYRDYGTQEMIVEKMISPANDEAIKASSAKFTAENMIVKRAELSDEIQTVLKAELNSFGINLIGVKLKSIDFSDKFDRAVEEKQIEEQKALQARYVAQRAEQEALAEITKQKGIGESQQEKAKFIKQANELLQQSLTPRIIQKQFLDKWDGKLPTVMTSDKGLMLQIPTLQP